MAAEFFDLTLQRGRRPAFDAAAARRRRRVHDVDSIGVLDHKPRHVIVRPGRNGRLLAHRGRTAYAVIDYGLLVPLPAADTVTSFST